jgi:Xaa-Pro dipeptidase
MRKLQPMTQGVTPISDDERRGRMEKARRLMAENKIDAIYLEAGSSLFYYTGITWGRTERMFAMILPRGGEPAYVTPGFEEERAREQIRFGDDIRRWEEDESPYKSWPESSRTAASRLAASASRRPSGFSSSTVSGRKRPHWSMWMQPPLPRAAA